MIPSAILWGSASAYSGDGRPAGIIGDPSSIAPSLRESVVRPCQWTEVLAGCLVDHVDGDGHTLSKAEEGAGEPGRCRPRF